MVVADRGGAVPLVVAGGLTVDAGGGRSAVQVAVLGLGLPIVISELDGGVPGQGWELRTSGLWIDLVCEQPFRHWSYGLEAFALALDDPAELLGRGLGHRVPLGWELEFESDDEPQWLGPPIEGAQRPAFGAYRQLGKAHGLLLTADGEWPIEGRAVRSHSWGGTALPAESVLAGSGGPEPAAIGQAPPDPTGDAPAAAVAVPGSDDVWWVQATAAGAATWHTPYDSSSKPLS
ncbi:MAG: hypothetical protein AAFN30_10120 [Actinomycetota bacterium]